MSVKSEPRVGAHLPLGPGMVKAVERAAAIGAAGMQIFSDNPSTWRRTPEPPGELEPFRQRMAELALGPLAIHAPYLINLAGSDPTFHERSIETLARELEVGAAYGAAFVNVHIGSHKAAGVKAGLARLAHGIVRVLDAVPRADRAPLLVLENSARSGDALGNSVEELADILDAAASAGADTERVAFCLDTAHLWAAGHDPGQPDLLDHLLSAFDARLGPGKLAMVHLNDARTALGSRLDRHEHIGAGHLGADRLRTFLSHPRLRDVPMYLETPGMDTGYDAINLERVRLLVGGEPLPELPGEAFAPHSARSRA